jgi:tetrahydromethanopterin S-methyltransferase subunit G
MSPATENLVLEHLRAIRATVDRLSDDMQEVKSRLGQLESQVAILTGNYASLSNRLDRVDQRILRIEKRLDLVDS